MPRRPRTSPRRMPRQRRAEDTVAVLLEATERVMADRGFAGATTNHIAEVAGVSIGTLYHYFPTKEALVEAVVHRMWRNELEAVAKHAALLETEPLESATRALVRALAEVYAQKMELYRRWYGEASNLGQLGLGLEMTNQAVAMVRAALERSRPRVRPKNLALAADLVVKTVLAVIRTGTRDYRAELASGELSDELADMITRYLLADSEEVQSPKSKVQSLDPVQSPKSKVQSLDPVQSPKSKVQSLESENESESENEGESESETK